MKFLIVIVVLTVGLAAATTVGQDPATGGPPDAALDSVFERDWVLQITDHPILGKVSFDLSDKTVNIKWVYSDHPAGERKNTARAKQVEPLDFWPTSVAALTESLVLVAGRRQNGKTIIQKWIIIPPLVTTLVNGSGVHLTPQAVASKTLVFSTSQPGMKDVAWMLPRIRGNGDSTTSVFVQFWDSKNVYSVDLLTGSAQIQASPTANVAPLVLPELDRPFDEFSYGMHVTEGFVLMLARQDVQGPTVLLQDNPVDGTLDVATRLTIQLANATRLLDADQYVPY